MRLLLSRRVAKLVRSERLDRGLFAEAAERAERGEVDADLGSGLLKQRIARPGGGRAGGFRVLLVLRVAEDVFFLFAFAKNDRASIARKDVERFRKVARDLIQSEESEIQALLAEGAFREWTDGEDLQSEDLPE